MPNRVAERTRDHPAGEDLGSTVFVGTGEANRTAVASPADAVQSSGALVVPVRLEPLGAAGGLARILVALVRQTYVGPRQRECVRANADRLLETIRVLSAL
jgi:hypothetical protein